MGGAVCVPYPVVGIECVAVVVMYLTVGGAEIASVLAQTYGTFMGPVERCVEYGLVIVVHAVDLYFTESFVPYVSGGIGHGVNVVVRYLATQIFFGLLCADERYAVADVNDRVAAVEAHAHACIASLGILDCGVDTAFAYRHSLGRHAVALHVQIHLYVVVKFLIAFYRVFVDRHLAAVCVEQKVGGLVAGVFKLVHRRLMRGCKAHLGLRFFEIYRVVVGLELLVVEAVGHDRLYALDRATVWSQIESRLLAVVGHCHGQPVDLVGGEVVAFGNKAQHAVGQMHVGKRRYQQVAYVADVGVHVVHRCLCVRSTA